MSRKIEIKSLSIPSVSRVLLCGPSNTGKTYLLRKLLKENIAFENKIDKILYFHSATKLDLVNAECFEGLDDIEKILESRKNDLSKVAVVIDDLQAEALNSLAVFKLWTIYSHHYNIGVVFLLLQNFYGKSKYGTDINRNSSYYIFTRHLRLAPMVKLLSRQLFMNDKLYDTYKTYILKSNETYPYLCVNLDAKDDRLMCFNNILKTEIPRIFI